MKLGLVGLPLSGKTTLFNAVTGAHGEVGSFHHGAGIHHATVRVPDKRLDKLAAIVQPKKITPVTIEYVDVPGLMADTSQDDAGQHVAALREADALAHVVRFFENASAPHPRGSLDPVRDAAEMCDELVIADLTVLEGRLHRLEKPSKKSGAHTEEDAREMALLQKCKPVLEAGQPLCSLELIDLHRQALRQFAFLTMKPTLFVLNVSENDLGAARVEEAAKKLPGETLAMCAKLEMEIAELDPGERQEFLDGLGIGEAGSSRLVRACYRLIGLRSFFTVVSGELRAWTVCAGDSAVVAAGKVHSDMARGFIRAEVTAFNDLVALGSFKAAKEAGKLRLEGKDYKVQDGDIITFRFNV